MERKLNKIMVNLGVYFTAKSKREEARRKYWIGWLHVIYQKLLAQIVAQKKAQSHFPVAVIFTSIDWISRQMLDVIVTSTHLPLLHHSSSLVAIRNSLRRLKVPYILLNLTVEGFPSIVHQWWIAPAHTQFKNRHSIILCGIRWVLSRTRKLFSVIDDFFICSPLGRHHHHQHFRHRLLCRAFFIGW